MALAVTWEVATATSAEPTVAFRDWLVFFSRKYRNCDFSSMLKLDAEKVILVYYQNPHWYRKMIPENDNFFVKS